MDRADELRGQNFSSNNPCKPLPGYNCMETAKVFNTENRDGLFRQSLIAQMIIAKFSHIETLKLLSCPVAWLQDHLSAILVAGWEVGELEGRGGEDYMCCWKCNEHIWSYLIPIYITVDIPTAQLPSQRLRAMGFFDAWMKTGKRASMLFIGFFIIYYLLVLIVFLLLSRYLSRRNCTMQCRHARWQLKIAC